MVFFDAISTGHRGYSTVHADNSFNTVNRLVTLMKRDVKAQMYTEEYLKKLLSLSLDLIIYMENFKVKEIVEVGYDEEKNDITYLSLYEFKIENYKEGKIKGKFKKMNKPMGKVKKKIELNKLDIERLKK